MPFDNSEVAMTACLLVTVTYSQIIFYTTFSRGILGTKANIAFNNIPDYR